MDVWMRSFQLEEEQCPVWEFWVFREQQGNQEASVTRVVEGKIKRRGDPRGGVM